MLVAYRKDGIEGLRDKKRGPTKNHMRTESIIKQVIRHRFLDSEASVAVIAQKMCQSGYEITKRGLERTITEYGLQKKPSSV